MEVNINIKMDASLVEAINRFCDIFQIKDIKNKIENVISESSSETKEEEINIEMLRKALINVKEIKGKEAAKKLLTNMGVANLTALPEEKYVQLWSNIKKAAK